jgi:DNA repair exonuclease SbcCD nuclease subunit
LLHLLEPASGDGTIDYTAWDESTCRGGFIDLGHARIFGSHWYGTSANWAIPMLVDAIRKNRREGAFHILMLHTDVEGHETHPIPALSRSALDDLREVVDYVALGHTHRHFQIDNWAFNPGSIEITSISDYRETRGVFLVDVDESNTITARHIDQYHHRPFQRLSFDVSGYADAAELTAGVMGMVSNEARRAEIGRPAPIIEITLRGLLGMPNSSLELRKMRDEARKLTGALCIRIKNQTAPPQYPRMSIDEDDNRETLERRVIEELVFRDNRYKTNADEIAGLIIGVKRGVLSDEPPENILEMIANAS